MKFYWVNCFNRVEFDGPFDTAEAAKASAVETFNEIQNGMALSIVIVEYVGSRVTEPIYFESSEERGITIDELLQGKIIFDGHIEEGKFVGGDSPRFSNDH